MPHLPNFRQNIFCVFLTLSFCKKSEKPLLQKDGWTDRWRPNKSKGN